MEQEFKIVFDPKIARKLLQNGHIITDIKPNRENKQTTIFVFANTEKFREDYKKLKERLN